MMKHLLAPLTVLVLLSMGIGAPCRAADEFEGTDFELLVDGEAVEISNFSLIEHGKSISGGVMDVDVPRRGGVSQQMTMGFSRPREDMPWFVIHSLEENPLAAGVLDDTSGLVTYLIRTIEPVTPAS